MMNIAFIRPSMFGGPSSDVMMPLVFAVIRALTPKDIQIDFYDERAADLPQQISAPVIAMTVETFSARRSYQLADRFRAQGKTVIMGGFHPTLMQEECLEHADAIITGDAEDTWPRVLADLKQGTLKTQYDSKGDFDISAAQYDYSVFSDRRYKLIGTVQFCRGCRYSCDFCSIHAFYHDGIRFRDISSVVEDIRNLKQKYLFFVDDNLFSDTRQASKLFDAIKPLKKRWVCQISMDVARDPDMLASMRKSGCIMVLIGFESLNVKNLMQMGKGANIKSGDYEEVIRNIYNAGLMIYGTFVIGYDGDTRGTAGELMDFALKHKFAVANFNPLMPMPGTPLYARLLAEGRMPFNKWWIDDAFHYGDAMLDPRGMSGHELMESCKEARYKFNTIGSLLKRMTNWRVNSRSFKNLFVFWAAGIVSRREIHFKQGRKLGASDENNAD